MISQFAFLAHEFAEILEPASRGESLAVNDPRTACFYARRALELAVTWAYEHDATLQLPYHRDLSALIHEPSFRNLAGQAVFQKCKAIKDLGNLAVHSAKPLTQADATAAVRELFHVCYWLVRTYAKGAKPEPGLAFDPNALPQTTTVAKESLTALQAKAEKLKLENEKLLDALSEKESLDEELKKLRAEVAAAKAANQATPDSHNYSEAQTRDLFIDLLLKEAGWPLDKPEDREYEVAGMPNNQGLGYVDYVLWGNDGKPLAVVEAKKTRRDAHAGQQQAKLYADCLEAKFGQRPIIFYTNGYEHWMWDDRMYPPRAVQGFYKKAELELLIQRRTTRRKLKEAPIDEAIVERYYQTRAIRRIGEAFEKDHSRRSLLVMATGSGKTRTVIALVDMLMRANWAKRVLFLADRTALVNQAVNAFKRHLPDASPVNLVTEKNMDGRVFVSTYPTMIGLIDEAKGDQRRFGVGHFDLVIIDEAHRSVFMKYGAIFDYFDSFLVGLTATPRDEINRNTYRLFELEDGVPTDAYPLSDAVGDGFLVPAKSVSVPLKLPTEGVVYENLSEEEKEQFELTDWKEREEDVLGNRRVEAPAVNQWLFNIDTVDKVLKHLMEKGIKVDGGDKLGKTIIFAKNHKHALFIADRFNKNYPQYKGEFARVVDYHTEYAQSIIDDFSNPKKLPQIAISVDMLDTGIDVPEVVNLVFFKQVRSKTKFWQMVGRGTRLCKDLFGPGQDKECFYIFDFCGNLEFFSQQIDATDGAAGASLSKRLFAARLGLLAAMAKTSTGASVVKEHVALYSEPQTDEEVFKSILELLKAEVGAMNVDNFIVRAKRRLVEKYKDGTAWLQLDEDKFNELEEQLAGLPSELPSEPPESKHFDLLILRLQSALLRGSAAFPRLQQELQSVAASLEEASNIPIIAAQLSLIQELQTSEWWEGVTLPMLELVRLRLRGLVSLVTHPPGSAVYTDFAETMGEESEITLGEFTSTISLERFREKVRAYLLDHLDREALQKLRLNEPLTESDLSELEAILYESGAGDQGVIQQASSGGLGLFVRSLVGLDREAAKVVLNSFVSQSTLNGTQIDFLNMVIDYLTEHGVMEPRVLYESPFTDLHSGGPEALLGAEVVDGIVDFLKLVKSRATP